MAFEESTSESKRLEEAAMILHRHILQAQTEAQEMYWPHSADYLPSISKCKQQLHSISVEQLAVQNLCLISCPTLSL